MQRIWSEEGKLARWLEVELAALDGWAELGAIPADDVASIRAGRQAAERRARRRDRAHHRPRHGGLRRRGHRAARAGRPLAASRTHLLGRGRYGAFAPDPGRGPARARRARPGDRDRDPSRRGAPRLGLHRPDPRHPRRAHDVRLEARRLGLRARSRPYPARAGAGVEPRRPALGHGRKLRLPRSGGGADRLRAARPRPRPALDAGDRARSPRRAALDTGARRDLTRPVRNGDPPPGAHRGARGRGAVRRRDEGLIGDAAQTQSEGRGADLRARARRTGRVDRRARKRRPLARARHLAVLGRTDRRPRRLPRARLHARSLHLDRRRSCRLPGADAPQPRFVPRPGLLARASPRARRLGPAAQRGLPARSAERDEVLGRRARLSYTRRRGSRDRPPGSMPPPSSAFSTSPPPSSTQTPCSTGCAP